LFGVVPVLREKKDDSRSSRREAKEDENRNSRPKGDGSRVWRGLVRVKQLKKIETLIWAEKKAAKVGNVKGKTLRD